MQRDFDDESARKGVFERFSAVLERDRVRSPRTRACQTAHTGGRAECHEWALVSAGLFAVVLALVALALVSTLGLVSASTGPPDGMVGVSEGNVDFDDQLPDHVPDHAAAWSVHADRGAGSLDVDVTTVPRGVGPGGQGPPGHSEVFALELTDTDVSDGRTVAVRADALEIAVGHQPTMAYGEHESGDEWTSTVEYRGGYAMIDVPHFSTQTVTFDGEISINAEGADNGTVFSYEIDETSGIDPFDVELTGAINERGVSESDSVGHDSSISGEIKGNLDPSGPGGLGSPELSVDSINENTEHGCEYGDGEDEYDFEFTVEVPQDHIDEFHATAGQSSGGCSPLDSHTGAGTDIELYVDDVKTDSYDMGGSVTDVQLDVDTDVSDQDTVDIRVTGDSAGSGSDMVFDDIVLTAPSVSSVDVDHDGETLTFGEGDTHTIDYDGGDISLAAGVPVHTVDATLNYTDRQSTIDPGIIVNGHQYDYLGEIGDAETETIEIDPEHIEPGKNEIHSVVSEGDMDSIVDINYTHNAPYDKTVSYGGETWSERYNVSRTWDDATDDPELTIPFSSDRVVSIRDVEVRYNSGEWEQVDYTSLDGSELTVHLDDVDAGDTVEVRAAGSKVDVLGGEIEVLDPTTEGDRLNTKFQIVDHSDEFEIDVSGTAEGSFIHSLYNESWTAPSPVNTFEPGVQRVALPDASSGSTARLQTHALEVEPSSGTVEITNFDGGSEPSWSAEHDGVSEVEYTYHDTETGTEYVLYSETHDIARDSATPSSPVTLLSSGYDETLKILSKDDDGATGSGSQAAVSGPVEAVGGASPLLVLVVAGGVLIGLAAVGRQLDVDTRFVAGAGLLVGVLAVETVAPGQLSGALSSVVVMVGSELGEVAPLVALVATGLGAYIVIRWWQTRTGPESEVVLQIGDD